MIKEFCDRCKKELKDGKIDLIKAGNKIILCPNCDKEFVEFINNPSKKHSIIDIRDV